MSRTPARARAAAGEVKAWKDRHDALLTVLNALLYAYGDGPEKRVPVSNAYLGQPRRPVVTEPMGGQRFIVYLGKEELHGDPSEAEA